MNEHIDIAVPDALAKRMAKRSKTISEAALDDIRSYYALIDATSKEMKAMFTGAEAALLCEIFKNADMGIDRFQEWPMLFAWDVEDVERCEKIGVSFGVDTILLVEKLEALKPHQALWLMDRIRQFRCTDAARAMTGEVLSVDFSGDGFEI